LVWTGCTVSAASMPRFRSALVELKIWFSWPDEGASVRSSSRSLMFFW